MPESYVGRFLAIGDNPALGPVLALDVGNDVSLDDVWFVLGKVQPFEVSRAWQ